MSMNWDQYQSSTPKLLPPTVFEKISDKSTSTTSITQNNLSNQIHEPSSSSLLSSNTYFTNDSQLAQFTCELEKLKNEIKKLHLENEGLRHRNRDFVEQAQLYTEVSDHRKISISTLEEIIHKQTREIQNLKSELINVKEINVSKLNDLEEKYTLKINDLIHKLNQADKDLLKQSNEYEFKLDQIKIENDKQLNDKLEQIDKCNKEIEKLNDNLNKLNIEKLNLIDTNSVQITKLNDENKKYLNELNNLKTYVNDSMPTIQTIREMTIERKKYEDEILKLKFKNDSLINENSALQIRLKSINEILTIQEEQLESSSINNKSFSLINEKKRLGLLNKWRNKVYELLIQLKSNEITFKQEKNFEEKTLNDLADKLNTETNRIKILESLIEDKKAEITVLTNDKTILNEQLSNLKETNDNLEKRCAQDLQSSIELKNFVYSLIENYQKIEDSFKQANKKLNHLDQRVEFAKNRLTIIKALYSNKELKRGNNNTTTGLINNNHNILEMTTNLSTIHGSLNPNELISHINLNNQASLPLPSLDLNNQVNDDNLNLIKTELDKVVNERDLLATKLQNDMNKMNDNIKKMKDEYELIISTLNNELKQLREANDVKQEQIDMVNKDLNEKNDLYNELNKKYDELNMKFNQLKNDLNLDNEKCLREHETQFMNKLAKMNEKLNEARREQAKAVVLMRQMERSTNREKERMENLLKSCDNYYKEHVKKLQAKVQSLEKEKNILMNSLRQQGSLLTVNTSNDDLVNKFKSSMDILNQNQTQVDNWLEKNSICDNKKVSIGEITSFWLDSKQEEEISHVNNNNNNDDNNQDELINNEEDELEMNEDLDLSADKNNEILQQIRKIMGNLELSDVEDDDDNDDNDEDDENERNDLEDDNNEFTNNNENRTNSVNKEENENIYLYDDDIEHAIDDIIFKKK